MRTSEPYTIFPKKLKSGKTVYYYQFRDENNKRSSPKSTGCQTLSQAKKYCNTLYNNGEFKKKSSNSFAVYTKDFFSKDSQFYQWKIASRMNITDSTLLNYTQVLKYRLLPFFENIQIEKITRSLVKQWVIWASKQWSIKSVNNAQSVLNLILKQAVDDELLNFNPATGLSFRRVEKKQRILLTLDEIIKIYHSNLWKHEISKNVFLLSTITGMRVGEIIALKQENIFDTYIDVKHSYNKATHQLGETKTHEKRLVPIPQDLTFLKTETGNIWIFEGNYQRPFNDSLIIKDLHYICERMGINWKARGITIHSMRNFFISYMQMQNISQPKIRAVVGHKDSTMTGLYTYWTPDMFPEIYEHQLELYNKITKGV